MIYNAYLLCFLKQILIIIQSIFVRSNEPNHKSLATKLSKNRNKAENNMISLR